MLSELLETERLVTVVGVGGMGKTRLAVEALRGHQLYRPDGVWFVDLSVAHSDRAVVDELASLFGLQSSPGRTVEDRLVEHLEDRNAVLVFDNCEHIIGPAARLIDLLLSACTLLKIVATSREALMLRGEHVMALGPLPVDPATEDVGGGVEVESVDLFLDRVIAEGGSADVAHHDRAVAVDICRQLDGMPLAIELAAARVRTLGAAGVLTRLGESLRLLSGGWRTSTGRQQTLLATLDWSYVLLDEHEQAVFDRLAVFVGWFTLDDAVAVAGDLLDQDDVIDALSGLVDKSMCTADLSTTPSRYRYLETMRSYGRDHLRQAGTLPECRDRHATHFADVAYRVRKALVGPDELAASLAAERLTADLRSALGWAVERRLDTVIDHVAAFAVVVGSRGDHEMSSWFYDLRDELPDNLRVQGAAVGHALFCVGDAAETRRLCARIIELDNGVQAGVGWQNLGIVAFNEGNYEQAIEYLLHAYELLEAMPDDLFDHVMNSVLLAFFLSSTGHDATEFVKQSLDRANAANWPTGVAYANCAAGEALLHIDVDASLAFLDRAITVAAGVGSRSVEALAMSIKMYLLSQMLPPSEQAGPHSHLLRRLEQIDETNTTLLALSGVVVLFDKVERREPAAVVCGWLDGRSGRNVQSVGDHNAAVTSIRRAVGDHWDRLAEQGRNMTRTQIIDLICAELATIQ